MVHRLLLIGVLLEFTGHGAFGLLGKDSWVIYIETLSFQKESASWLLPLVGTIDILIGVVAFFFPRKVFFLYMSLWGLFTASLRPFSGENFFEFIERSYNWGVPLLFLLLHKNRKWFELIRHSESNAGFDFRLIARVTISLMLFGHGMLQLNSGNAIGWVELSLAAGAIFIKAPGYFYFICLWKLGTEFSFVINGTSYGWLEFIERGSAYVAPLVLAIILSEEREDPA